MLGLSTMIAFQTWFTVPKYTHLRGMDRDAYFQWPISMARLGPVRQKAMAKRIHVEGVHQVMVFCGTARTGMGASERSGLKKGQGKGQVKGKGQDKGGR